MSGNDQGFNNNAPPPPTTTTMVGSPDSSTASSESPRCLLKSADPRVVDLIYWRDVHRSALVLACTLVTLLSFVMFSVLSVIAYSSLIVMTSTLSYRVYKNIKAAVYKTGEGHPYQRYLDMDISLDQPTLSRVSEQVYGQLFDVACTLRRLFLIEDMVDSLKFYALLYLMTCIGSWFNATTLIILVDVAVFSLPKLYEVYEVEVNEVLKLVQDQISSLSNQVKQSVQASGLKKYL